VVTLGLGPGGGVLLRRYFYPTAQNWGFRPDLLWFKWGSRIQFINTILERARTLQKPASCGSLFHGEATLRLLKDSSYDDWCFNTTWEYVPISASSFDWKILFRRVWRKTTNWVLRIGRFQGDGDGGFRATTLVLQGKFLYTDSFPTFLRSFKSLKRFHCDYWGGSVPKTLADGIAQLSNCLEELSVTHSEPGYVFHSYDNTMNSILPLSGFTALKILRQRLIVYWGRVKNSVADKAREGRLPRIVLTKYECITTNKRSKILVKRMPPSLKHLTLLDCSEGIIDVLFELLKDNVLHQPSDFDNFYL